MTLNLRSLLLALLMILPLAHPAWASDRADNLQDAIAQVQRETGGRVLSADAVPAGGRELYRIKVLTPDGRVRVITKTSRVGSDRR
jgi:hypothetical protein